MRFETWTHVGVTEAGDIIEDGAVVANVHTERGVVLGDGCGIETCRCSKGLWLSISAGRDASSTVCGVTVSFDSRDEMEWYLSALEVELATSPIAAQIR